MSRGSDRLVKITTPSGVVVEVSAFSSGHALVALRVGARDSRAVLDPLECRAVADALWAFAEDHG